MKRFFFSLIALSAAAVGCTQSALLETPDQFGTEITFSPYTGRTPVTKATSIEGEADLAADGFQVMGYLNDDMTNPYMNKTVTSTDGTNWSYTGNAIYWPDANSSSTLSFVAYSVNAEDYLAKTNTGFTFTVPSTIDDQVDLLATSYQKGYKLSDTDNRNGQVRLQFYHLLSRVGFKVLTTTDKEVKINSLTFSAKMPKEGMLVYAEAQSTSTTTAIPTLTAVKNSSNNKETYTYASNVTIANAQTDAQPIREGQYMMLIPHGTMEDADGQGSDHHINVTYQIKKSADGVTPVQYSTEKTAQVRLPIGFEFKAGKAYEIILNISTSALTFNITEQGWGDPVSSDDLLEPEIPAINQTEMEVSSEDVTLQLQPESITATSATFTLNIKTDIFKNRGPGNNINGDGKDSHDKDVDDKDVGIAFRQINTDSWNYKDYCAGDNQNTVSGTNYQWTISNLTPGETYECCFYSASRTWEAKRSWLGYSITYQDWTPRFYDGTNQSDNLILTFTTLNAKENIIPETPPTVILNDITDTDITENSVNISGSYIAGVSEHKEGESAETEDVIEYGFCWRIGTDAPSVVNSKQSFTNKNSEGVFSYSIENLAANETYTCCTYVITESNNIYYSAPQKFTTKPITSEKDDTGSQWEQGGETDFEN